MLFAARSHIGLVRQMNQDGYGIHPEFAPLQFVVVADGMGGASAGEVASRMAVDTVSAVVREGMQAPDFDVREVLYRAIVEANRQIWEKAKEVEEYIGMGTTVVAALFDEHKIVLAHVGDSRGYILGANGLKQLTEDHSLVAELVRRGQITETEALRHPQRHIVTRSLGTLEFSTPEVHEISWEPGHVLLLCTDGLSNLITSAEIEQYLRRVTTDSTQRDVDKVADDLLRLALERGGPDNITLVIVVHRKEGGVA